MAAGTETLTGNLSGEAFLRDFKAATEIAAVVPTFESWVLAGSARNDLVEQVRQNPVAADEQLAAGGLTTLLTSNEEQERIQELVEEARRLDITRFLGYKATVSAQEKGSGAIYKAPVANTMATGTLYLSNERTWRKSRTAKLTSLSPATESFRIGEYRSRLFHWTAFWEIFPFDEKNGEPVVDMSFQGPRESLPSLRYQQWWAANRG